jgi:putative heme degradation protein
MNLLELIAKGPEEIESYLGDVTTVQFIEDVKMSLSKVYDRKQAAMAAMQGLVSGHPDQIHNQAQGATLAVSWADELLKALES